MSAPILPPDPEEMNDRRADWALEALQAFADATGADLTTEALGDLLSDLRHLCDRQPELGDFEVKIARARACYLDEIAAPGTLYAGDPDLDAEYAAYDAARKAAGATDGNA